VDTFEPIRELVESNTVRVGFIHRLQQHLDLALGEHTLKFYFRNTPPNRHTETDDVNFRDRFIEAFDDQGAEIRTALPDRAELTGNMHNMIEATYEIPVANAEDFQTAYLTALETAVRDHAIENPEFVELGYATGGSREHSNSFAFLRF
jgi:hypothetical protein